MSVPGCRRQLGRSLRTDPLAGEPVAGQGLAVPALPLPRTALMPFSPASPHGCPHRRRRGFFFLPPIQQQGPKGGKGILLAFSQPLPHAAHMSLRPAQGAVWCPPLRALTPRMCFKKKNKPKTKTLFTLLFPGHRLGCQGRTGAKPDVAPETRF